MHLDSTGLLQLEREHDGYIMEMIVQSQQYTDKENYQIELLLAFLEHNYVVGFNRYQWTTFG